MKCSHGATVGEIEPDALFYLRARGVGETEARRMLIEAFLGDVLEDIADESVRSGFARAVESWLAGVTEGAR